MNIAFVLPEFMTEKEAAGLATYYDNISRLLADEGHKITIFVRADKTERVSYYSGITVERVLVDLQGINPNIPGSFIREWSRVLGNKLREYVENGNKIDLVQYPNFMSFGLDRINIPTVVRISSYLPLLRAADQEEFDVTASYDCIKVTDYMEEIALMKADAVYGPSRLLANLFSKKTGMPVSVIESPFYSRDGMKGRSEVYKAKLQNKQYILSFGTLKALKGAKLIGDSIYDILDAFPNLYWVFAGAESVWTDREGKKVQPSDYIKFQGKEYANRMIFLGKLEQSELYDVVNNARFCVMPSRIDNLPNTCIEAMALGKIVVGTKGASFEQLIEDGKSGFLVERENKEMLVQVVKRVYQLSEDERRIIGEKAKLRIKEMEPKKIIEQLLSFYSEVIQNYEEGRETSEYYKQVVEKYNIAMKNTNMEEAEQYRL